MHQHPVVTIKRHEIRDRTERRQVEQIRNGRRIRAQAARLHFARERRHDVERDADAGERLAGKGFAGCVRIHDRIRGWQRLARQMVIGDERLDAERGRRRDAGVTRYAVVDGDDELRFLCSGEAHDLGRKAVAELKAVGHEKLDAPKAKTGKLPHDQRGARGAIRIEIADDDNPALSLVVSAQEVHCLRHAPSRLTGINWLSVRSRSAAVAAPRVA